MKSKSIIITGGGSGIGAATVIRAAEAGALVTIVDIDAPLGQRLSAEVAASGGVAQFVRADISNERDVIAMVDATISRFGRLDCAFNNAGVPAYSHASHDAEFTLFADLPLEAFNRCLAINAAGTFLCMKYEIKAMLTTGGGAIVNTSSNAGILAIAGAADYMASKHAIIGLTKSAALDYAKRNIRVNAVLPGVVRTPMMERSLADHPELLEWAAGVHPNGRIATPLEIAEAAMWLLSDAASFVTGISLSVDGGFSMV
jgi:NAD(P)-dependent dehydrogenase (short-subunit alcohol dehydrogenase family)